MYIEAFYKTKKNVKIYDSIEKYITTYYLGRGLLLLKEY